MSFTNLRMVHARASLSIFNQMGMCVDQIVFLGLLLFRLSCHDKHHYSLII